MIKICILMGARFYMLEFKSLYFPSDVPAKQRAKHLRSRSVKKCTIRHEVVPWM